MSILISEHVPPRGANRDHNACNLIECSLTAVKDVAQRAKELVEAINS